MKALYPPLTSMNNAMIAAPNIGTTTKSGSRNRDSGARMRTRRSVGRSPMSPLLPDGRDALAHADAHRGQAVLRVAVLQLAHQRADEACTAATQRMAER